MTATTPAIPRPRLDHVRYTFDCGPLAWRVREVLLEERMDAPFRGELRLVTADADAVTDDLLGRSASFTMHRGDATRTFRGEITYADVMQGPSGAVAAVRFEPAIVGLARAARHRVFQNRTTVQIVREVVAPILQLRLVSDVRSELPPREYCTQYAETDLAFARRLLAEDGIAWFLDDEGETQTMRLVDSNAAITMAAGPTEWQIVDSHFDEASQESVQSLRFVRRRPAPGVVDRSWDWLGGVPGIVDARVPAEAHETVHELQHVRRNAAAVGDASARHEYERLASLDLLGRGTSNATAFAAGRHVGISITEDAPVPLLLTRVLHLGDCPEAELGALAREGGPNYTNRFECQPLDVQYRPQPIVARPRIHSLHTAVVVGPPDEEIHTDEHGRIRVRMHWDRATNPDEDASCWLRVAQSWAGQGWGSMFIPRVGMEVLVAFLDGDPDRPICVGCVYNGAHRPPYDLPADRTKSTIRTQSTPGGAGHNELTFDDAAGSEQIYVRAQRDLLTHVLHDLNTKVDGSESRHVGGRRQTEVDADDVLHVRKDEIHNIDGAHELHVAGSVALQIDGGPALGDAAVTAPGMTVSIIQGGYRLCAPQRIELVCGPSTIIMTPAGITMTGPSSVNVVCGGASVALAPGALSLLAPLLSIAAPGASLGLGATASLSSPGGVKLGCGDECELNLSGAATLRASRVMIEAGSEFVAEATRAQVTGFDEAVLASDVHVRLEDTTARVVLEDGMLVLPE